MFLSTAVIKKRYQITEIMNFKKIWEGIQGLIGLTVGVFATIHSTDSNIFKEVFKGVDIIVFLLGIISVLIGIEKFTHFRDIEKRFDNVDEAKNALLLNKRDRQEVFKLFNAIIFYLLERKKYNPEFKKFSFEQVNKYRKKFDELKHGELKVQGFESLDIQGKLLETYTKSFYAVSYNDIDFWIGNDSPDSIGKEYFRLNSIAVNRRGTTCTRIFIINKKDIFEKKNDIITILNEHTINNVGWAIAVYDLMSKNVSEIGDGLELDFALFDYDLALTHFDKVVHSRKFRVVFKTSMHHKVEVIDNQIGLYCDLIKECWLVDSKFANIYHNSFGYNDYKPSISDATKKANNHLKFKLEETFQTDDDVFVLVSNGKNQIEQKMEELIRILKKIN